jgi:hypothetical protein
MNNDLTCLLALSLPLLLTACDPASSGDTTGSTGTSAADDGATGDGTTTTADPTSADGDSGDASSGGMVDDTGGGDLVWSEISGPCGGSATNAMWFDDQDHGFAGCGENAAGEGLFVTSDGGMSWQDESAFGEVRIMDLRRGPDGVLYGAGTDQLDGFSLWSIDESGADLEVVGLYTPSNNAFTSVGQGENAAVTAGGQILVDSLTGTSAAYQPAGGAFEEHYSIGEAAIADPDNAPAFQVRRIVAFDEQFFAVGSLINDPARVHLPSQLPGATFHFQTVQLQSDTRDGELLDMHVWSPTHMIVAGHDQSERYPLIYVVDGDPYSGDNWQQVELADSGIEYQAGVNDIDVVGDTVVAVGEKIPTAAGGFVVISQDAGLTWEDVTPEGAGELSAVKLFDDGQMVVGGGGGEMWRYGAAL